MAQWPDQIEQLLRERAALTANKEGGALQLPSPFFIKSHDPDNYAVLPLIRPLSKGLRWRNRTLGRRCNMRAIVTPVMA